MKPTSARQGPQANLSPAGSPLLSPVRPPPRTAGRRQAYERRCWPFCAESEAMLWEDQREGQKIRREQVAETGLPWEQPEYLGYGLTLGLGLSGPSPGRSRGLGVSHSRFVLRGG